MIKSSFLFSITGAALSLCVAACSNSDAGTGGSAGQGGESTAGTNGQAGTHEAGADSGGADTAGADTAGADNAGADNAGSDNAGSDAGGADTSGGGSSAGSSSEAGSGSLPAGTSSCQYSVTGGATETSPEAASVCGQSKVTTAYGGGFSATIAGGFQDAAGNIVSLACLIDSPTAPAAGDSWSLGTAAQSQGNCSFNIVSNAQATIWSATANDAKVIGAATVKFKSVTLTHGVNKPSDVYYFFDATIDATIPGQSDGAAEVKVTGRYRVQTLPLGS